jgi:hypothetical protein
MKKLITICLVVTMILVIGNVANADWIPGQPAKWVQLPDLSSTGMDVLATHPNVLADDFLCTQTGPITDIHIWGSWNRDILPMVQNSDGTLSPDPAAVGFRLSIHSDIPAGPTGNYSRPGELLWEKTFAPGTFKVNLYADKIEEGWYDPAAGVYNPQGDHQAWQYNFFIDPALAFMQKGTASNPMTYWLDVEAFPVNIPGVVNAEFGWKTSVNHWNDDAVWADPSITPPIGWQELRYPSNHPFAGNSIDMAFVITPEPTTICLLGLGIVSLIRRKK